MTHSCTVNKINLLTDVWSNWFLTPATSFILKSYRAWESPQRCCFFSSCVHKLSFLGLTNDLSCHSSHYFICTRCGCVILLLDFKAFSNPHSSVWLNVTLVTSHSGGSELSSRTQTTTQRLFTGSGLGSFVVGTWSDLRLINTRLLENKFSLPPQTHLTNERREPSHLTNLIQTRTN